MKTFEEKATKPWNDINTKGICSETSTTSVTAHGSPIVFRLHGDHRYRQRLSLAQRVSSTFGNLTLLDVYEWKVVFNYGVTVFVNRIFL